MDNPAAQGTQGQTSAGLIALDCVLQTTSAVGDNGKKKVGYDTSREPRQRSDRTTQQVDVAVVGLYFFVTTFISRVGIVPPRVQNHV